MPTTTFIIHVYDEVEPIDIGATFGVLSMARRVDPGIAMALVANKTGPVRLSNGLDIIAPYSLTDCPAGDVLMILGGGAWPRVSKDEQTLRFIRSFARTGIVASVCTGALILASAGLLEGKCATTRRFAPAGVETPLAQLEKLHPGVKGTEARFVDSGSVVTGGGVVLAVDTTLHLIGRLRGAEVAKETARIIEYRWNGNDGAFSGAAGAPRTAAA